jgi:hypothetical protein
MSTAGRLEVRAVITFSQPTPVANPSTGPIFTLPVAATCPLIPTLEIIDTDSKTVVASSDFRFISYGFLTSTLGTSLPPR